MFNNENYINFLPYGKLENITISDEDAEEWKKGKVYNKVYKSWLVLQFFAQCYKNLQKFQSAFNFCTIEFK